MTDIHDMNALKIVLATVLNAVAAVTFIATGPIVWPQAVVMIGGAARGGYSADHYTKKLPQQLIRAMVPLLGVTMTVYFLVKACWH
jgi:uncharacterized membrane protein YfcA